MTENINKIIKNTLRDIAVELKDEFDQNFERQAFFSQAWQRKKYTTKNNHILLDTGTLRRSIRTKTTDNSVTFYTDLPYAAIHNTSCISTTREQKARCTFMHRDILKFCTRRRTGDFCHKGELHPRLYIYRVCSAANTVCKVAERTPQLHAFL